MVDYFTTASRLKISIGLGSTRLIATPQIMILPYIVLTWEASGISPLKYIVFSNPTDLVITNVGITLKLLKDWTLVHPDNSVDRAVLHKASSHKVIFLTPQLLMLLGVGVVTQLNGFN